jgi:hypothetical protein
MVKLRDICLADKLNIRGTSRNFRSEFLFRDGVENLKNVFSSRFGQGFDEIKLFWSYGKIHWGKSSHFVMLCQRALAGIKEVF